MTVDVTRFNHEGYLCPFPVYGPEEFDGLRALYWRLRQLLPEGVSTQEMDWWHGEDRELWAIASEPRILDLVEPILGPDFYLWGSQFFSKDPGDQKTTPWHQDAFFWPLAPHNSVTVWVAFEDSDADNGAMKVIPGTHRAQHIQHEDSGKRQRRAAFARHGRRLLLRRRHPPHSEAPAKSACTMTTSCTAPTPTTPTACAAA